MLVGPHISLAPRAEELNGRTSYFTNKIPFGYPNLSRGEDQHSTFRLMRGLEDLEGGPFLGRNLFFRHARGTPFHPEDEVLSTSHGPKNPIPKSQTAGARKKASRPDRTFEERRIHGRKLVLALGIRIQGRQLQLEEALSVAQYVQGSKSNVQPIPHRDGW